ncbi:cobalamin-binding protein [Candidatus Bathyarchaeota archaeon]|nr:MAG: cobalamin-binding protein [Candidatus Bathyarchaeota archaeon]TMI51733.1 MAG: cobalamin-binding protein [Candidatus Bathyarchaeota archaeon]
MRICSLLPSATEIAFALGLADQVVAVSHECDYPPEASNRPVLTKSAIHQKIHRSLEVDREVEQRGGDIYEIDEKLLANLKPDLILTQELCHVCAVSYTRVKEAARVLDADTKIVSLEPTNLEEIVDNILLVGRMTNKLAEAEKLAAQMLRRIDRVREKTKTVQDKPRVFFMEWLQPPWAGGHWIPQMVDYAGGFEGLGRLGKPSHRIEWDQVVEYEPEIIVLSPCGLDANQVMEEAHVLASYTEWNEIPAFQSSRIYAVNASAYFSRSGPRVVDGLEILAHIIHPELFPENPHPEAVKTVPKGMIRA